MQVTPRSASAPSSRAAARHVREVTGYGRVLVYQFDTDGHGRVLAESKEDGYESYLGQYFPASDVPAQARALRRDDDGAVDEHGRGQHGVEQLVVGQRGVVQPLLGVFGLARAQQRAQRLAGGVGNGLQLVAAGRRLQVFDDHGLDAALAQQRQRVARGAAIRVVVEGDGAHRPFSVFYEIDSCLRLSGVRWRPS